MSSFSQFAEWLSVNPWLSVASVIIALSSVILTIIFSKSKKIKLPYYAVRSVNLVRDMVSSIESLEMLYSGEHIENLTATKIALWNAGHDTINSQDIASAAPLTVHIKGGKILDAKVDQKNPANKFSVDIADDKSYATIQFDYIDKNEGVVIRLFHTGKSSEDIEINGKIKGVGKPIPILVPPPPLFELAIMCFIVPIILIASLIFLLSGITVKPKIVLILIIVGAIILITFWGQGFYHLKRRRPQGFEVFEEKF
ncbi:MAG: hypothetical protein KAT65_30755 [Methanophagales archaeon]|nr:hypothetical protein [Methanophagales archaeon]